MQFKYSKEWLPYLIFAGLLLVLAIYGLWPKQAPTPTMSIGLVQVMQRDNTTAVLRIPITWESRIQPTYITVDVQPTGAPNVIALEDRDKYHLIRAPQKWVNTKTTFLKHATMNYDCLIVFDGHAQFTIKAKLSNDDLKDVDALVRAEIPFSLDQQAVISK